MKTEILQILKHVFRLRTETVPTGLYVTEVNVVSIDKILEVSLSDGSDFYVYGLNA